jgi:hypothetical protein
MTQVELAADGVPGTKAARAHVPTETHQENARLSGLVFAVRGDALRDLGAVAARMEKTIIGECMGEEGWTMTCQAHAEQRMLGAGGKRCEENHFDSGLLLN